MKEKDGKPLPPDAAADSELLQAVINSSEDLIQVFRAVRNGEGQIVDFVWVLINETARLRLGDVMGHRLLELHPGLEPLGIFAALVQVVETGCPERSERYYHHERISGWFYLSVVKLDDGVVTTARDITERRQREQEIGEQARFIRSVTDAVPGVVSITRHPSVEVLFTNRDALQLLGFDPEQMAGMTREQRWQLVHPDDLAPLGEYYGRFDAMSDDTDNHVEYRVTNAQGAQVWFDVRGRVFRRDSEGRVTETLHIGLDATRRKQAEEEVARQAKLIGEIAEMIPDVVSVLELPSRRIIYINKSGRSQPGFGEQTNGMAPDGQLNTVHPDDRGCLEEYYHSFDAATPDDEVRVVRYRSCAPDGKQAVLVARGKIFRRDRHNQVAAILNVVEDVTEKEAADRELNELRERITAFDKEKYYSLFNSVGEGFCILEQVYRNGLLHDFYIRETNPAFSRITGLHNAQGQLAGQVLPAVLPAWVQGFERVEREQRPLYEEREIGAGEWYGLNFMKIGGAGHPFVALLFDDISQRKSDELALRESETRFRSLVESYAQAVWETDADGRVVADSPSWRSYTGQSREQWLSDGWREALHPDDRMLAALLWADSVAQGIPVNSEYRLWSQIHGEYRWTNVRATPIVDGQGKVIKWTGMNIDIDHRKAAEDALRESEHRLSVFIDAIPLPVGMLDTTGRFVNCNRHMLRFVPNRVIPSVQGVAGRRWEGWWPDGRPVEPKDYPGATALRGEHVPGMEMTCIEDNGQKTWMLVSAVPVFSDGNDVSGAVIAIADISELKLAAQHLDQSRQQLAMSFEAAKMGSFEWGSASRSMQLSPGSSQVLGLRPGEAISMQEELCKLLHPEDLLSYLRTYEQAEAIEKGYYLEYRVIRPIDGVMAWIAERGKAYRDQHSQAMVVRGVHWDITEKKDIEKALLASERRLMELNEDLEKQVERRTQQLTRLRVSRAKEKLGVVIYTQEQERARISEGLHDGVAQLLYAAQNRLQALRPSTAEDASTLDAANVILAEAIEDTRRISFELMPPMLKDHGLEISLRVLIQRLIGTSIGLKCDIQVRGRLPEKLEIMVYRIVQEILNNTMRHARATEAGLSIKVTEKYIHLSAYDNGIGFLVKAAQSSPKGTGLQSIRNRVKLVNGRLRIISGTGKGTVFDLQIPFS